jgi:hypothetical protein
VLQQKKEDERSANQPSAIPGYFDPAEVNIYIPTVIGNQNQ